MERHNVPEVEDRSSRELLLQPVLITRGGGSQGAGAGAGGDAGSGGGGGECTLIEPSINSVRVSVRLKQVDELERLLTRKFAAFLQQRAEAFRVLRRVPVPGGYDLSFLITSRHLESLDKARLADFVVGFLEGAWAVCGRGRGGGWDAVRWCGW